jgi:uncharacterized membrane-anchored protein
MDDFTQYCLTGCHVDLKPLAIKELDDISVVAPKWVYDREFCYKMGGKYKDLSDWTMFVDDTKDVLTREDITSVREWLAWIGNGKEDFAKALWFTGDRRRSEHKRYLVPKVDDVMVSETVAKTGVDTKMTQYFPHALVPIYKPKEVVVEVDDTPTKKKKKKKEQKMQVVDEDEFTRDVKAFNKWIRTKPIDKHLLLTMTEDEVEEHKDVCRLKL